MQFDPDNYPVVVVGAGLVGCLMSVMLARRGFDVTLIEKRRDLRLTHAEGGRSINLVLTNRGLRGLTAVGLRDELLEKLTVPVLGRMMHDTDGELTYQPYGKDDSECNYSVSRADLNIYLLERAEEAGVKLLFDLAVEDVDFDAGVLTVEDQKTNETTTLSADVIIGADGAPSAIRKALVAKHGFSQRVEFIEHGYKEVTFPAEEGGEYPMAPNSLHIWPRGHHMLMGLADMDGSFTGTVYLPLEGEDSFAQLDTGERVRAFFTEHYPDSVPLLPELEQDFEDNPLGTLGTVRAAPWNLGARAVLIGDAAHAIVPFFGQGCNCGFEDCAVLAELLDEMTSIDDLEETFERYYQARKTNSDAIADMALENFIEMRDKVGDDAFLLRKKVERAIERAMPHKYRSRYATVMYSTNPYRDAFDAGLIQDTILAELTSEIDTPDQVDMTLAERLIDEHLTPFYAERGVDLIF